MSAISGLHISAETLKEIISVFNKNMSWMTNNEVIEKALDNLVKTSENIGEEEKKVLGSVVVACNKIRTADTLAYSTVEKLLGHLRAVLAVLGSQDQAVISAVQLYVTKLKEDVVPSLRSAHKAVEEAAQAQVVMKEELEDLEGALDKKIVELVAEGSGAESGARGVAYGGAMGATVGVAAIIAALNFWNPVGWVAATAAAAAGTALTFGVAAGVVEGGQIPKLKQVYKTTVEEVKRARAGMESLIGQTGEFQGQVMDKVILLEESEDLAGLILSGNTGLIKEFKRSLEALKGTCEEYMNQCDNLINKELNW